MAGQSKASVEHMSDNALHTGKDTTMGTITYDLAATRETPSASMTGQYPAGGDAAMNALKP